MFPADAQRGGCLPLIEGQHKRCICVRGRRRPAMAFDGLKWGTVHVSRPNAAEAILGALPRLPGCSLVQPGRGPRLHSRPTDTPLMLRCVPAGSPLTSPPRREATPKNRVFGPRRPRIRSRGDVCALGSCIKIDAASGFSPDDSPPAHTPGAVTDKAPYSLTRALSEIGPRAGGDQGTPSWARQGRRRGCVEAHAQPAEAAGRVPMSFAAPEAPAPPLVGGVW